MYENSISPTKYAVIGLLLVLTIGGLFVLPSIPIKAQNQTNNAGNAQEQKPARFSDAIATNTLCSAGLQECNAAKAERQSGPSGSLLGNIFGVSGKPKADPVITVVNVSGQNAVYRIVNGQKHSIPTTEIFESYGFGLEVVQPISRQELDKYPLARLFMVESDPSKDNPTIYYLTESGMIRPMLNDRIFYSYGNRKEDVITINQKEFNYYPRNQFVFIERPQINREIYQIAGGIKRYLTPVAVKRMNLKESEIAPINQIEFDEYPTGEAVIF